MDFPQLPPAVAQIVRDKAQRYGIDPNLLGRMVKIESGGKPNASTGSYHGLMQMSQGEFSRYGGGGKNIYDPEANLDAAAQKTAAEIEGFRRTYGRDPTPTEIYMQHQQGVGGYAAHSASPDAPAWQNMYSTAEGREKGPGWAKQAIWGNVPSDVKAQFPGGVDSLTSRDFLNIWQRKVEGDGNWSPTAPSGETPGLQVASSGTTTPEVAPSPGASKVGLLGLQLPGVAADKQVGAADQALAAGMQQMAQGSRLPFPNVPPQQLNFPTPVGLRLARAASSGGLT